MLCTWVIADDYISDKGHDLNKTAKQYFPHERQNYTAVILLLMEEGVSLKVTLSILGCKVSVRP